MTRTQTRSLSARQLMNPQPRSCSPDTPLNEAARLMWEGDFGAVPVVRDEQVIAMVTDRDICMAAYTKNQPLSALRVDDAMSSGLVSCAPDEALEDVQEKMRVHQVRRVPVVDHAGHLQGLLSLNDLTVAATRPGGELAGEELLDTLARIGERRQVLAR